MGVVRGLLLAVMAVAVVWILAKMTRTDQADWLLIRLGAALAAGALIVALAMSVGSIRRGSR